MSGSSSVQKSPRITADDIIRPSSRLIELARAAQAGEDSLADGAVGAGGFGFVLVSQVETDACWGPLGGRVASLPTAGDLQGDFEIAARTVALVRGQVRLNALIEELFYLVLFVALPDGGARQFRFYMGASGLALAARNARAYDGCRAAIAELASTWHRALLKVEPAALNWRAESDFGWHPIQVEGTTPTPPFTDDDVEWVLLEAMQRHTPSDTRALLDVLIAWSALAEQRQAAHRPRFEAAVRSGWDAGADAIEASLDRLDDRPDDPAARDVVERLYPLLFGPARRDGSNVDRQRGDELFSRHDAWMQRWWPAACWTSAQEDLA